MYSYTWDSETGGLLLKTSHSQFSKEPRPVYSAELDLIGFDKYWKYDKDTSTPLMWAESNNYIYKGRTVAKVIGGSCFAEPTIQLIEPLLHEKLVPVDISRMVEKNKEILDALKQQTIKKIYEYFEKYQKKGVDVFYVAFSGGKDSIVTLDLVQKSLPHNAFYVLFGDTGMEFPDTYKTVDIIEQYCHEQSILFIRTKSDYSPIESWKLFGPPASVLRWCCSVHKTAPQILALRKMTNKPDFTGMAFIGIRASESASRSSYNYISLGEKHKGQYNCNPILEWNSAELYIYIFSEKLHINDAYIKGNHRVGCLLCPCATVRSEFLCEACYPKEFKFLLEMIKYGYKNHFSSYEALEQFVNNGGWKARKNGRDLVQRCNYEEVIDNNEMRLVVYFPHTDWKQWIKTIGTLQNDFSPYIINFRGENYTFKVDTESEEITVKFDASYSKIAPTFVKFLKRVFRKVATCVGCRVCEADCLHGAIHFTDGKVIVDDTCCHCAMCHKVDNGCLVYKSLEKPKKTNMNSTTKSLNCYSHHAPKMDWFVQFFNYKEDFAAKHSLGTNMFDFFKRFLKDAELMNKNTLSRMALTLERIGLQEDNSWALMLVNLVYTPQFNWYINNLYFNEEYSREYVSCELINAGVKETWINDIWSAFGRFCDLPFSRVGYGEILRKGSKAVAIIRHPWLNPDQRVILYSLYRYAEACGDYYQFTYSHLYDDTIESDGISPRRIFGISKDNMRSILIGLSSNYREYINATFTHDLDNISLNRDFASQDILNLF